MQSNELQSQSLRGQRQEVHTSQQHTDTGRQRRLQRRTARAAHEAAGSFASIPSRRRCKTNPPTGPNKTDINLIKRPSKGEKRPKNTRDDGLGCFQSIKLPSDAPKGKSSSILKRLPAHNDMTVHAHDNHEANLSRVEQTNVRYKSFTLWLQAVSA